MFIRENLGRVALCLALAIPFSLAAGKRHVAANKPASEASAIPGKELMQKVFDAWGTMNPQNVAKFYATGPNVFYNVLPPEYESWEQYQRGAEKVLSGFQFFKATVGHDAHVHRECGMAWGTASVHEEFVFKDRSKGSGDYRWTVIWKKTGSEWLIVHEHTSAPLIVAADDKK